ncbi:MAG: hypothetical protein JWN45_3143 [Acidobacteriaceae bacterium]|nr:hypothetical protein [Acidobacteriaceae bacterium]
MSKKPNIAIVPKNGGTTLVKRTLTLGNHSAELYADSRTNPPLYHYIVTHKDSADIIAWGQTSSAAEAERGALDFIHGLNGQVSKAG